MASLLFESEENIMSSRPTAYAIFGYDKDADNYIQLAYWYGDIKTAKSIAKYLATLSLKRTNGEPFDWIEVGEEYSGVRYCAYPCI